MSAALAEMTPGFRDATRSAQKVFRVVLDAMSRPGTVLALPDAALDGVIAPSGLRRLGTGTTAILLTLLDAETNVRLCASLASADAVSYLRFHTGVRSAWMDEFAAFTVAHADDVGETLWQRLDLGSDEVPQRGATLVVQVDGFDQGPALAMQGPGVQSVNHLRVRSLSLAFWQWRIELQRLMPRGIDLILVCGDRVAAIPRSTRIALEA
jgi:alpha-D-ribose 1-methylphosphonate 5-triphosphate synthase subunit PhnH